MPEEREVREESIPGAGPLPLVTPENESFWTAGARGALTMLRCQDCSYFTHPPAPVCGRCRSWKVAPAELTGRGTVHSYTVSSVQWFPGVPAPYVVATVELADQAGLRLTSRLEGCPPHQVRIGMPVRVVFEAVADIWRPLFEPDEQVPADSGQGGAGI